MSSKNLTVSICIPTYSRLSYLQKAVESARKQTYTDLEICVSQNPKIEGPDKNIQAWCTDQALKGNLRYNLNETNKGLSGNLNRLTQFATGDYLIFLGDDDLLHENFVETAISKASLTGAEVVFCNQIFINKDGNILKETKQINQQYKRDIMGEGLLQNKIEIVFNNSIPLSASIIKKNVLSELPFDEDLNTPEFPFFLKLALKNHGFYYIKQQLAYYRIHTNSETSTGLTIDKFLKNIISIKVPNVYNDKKKQFISSKIIPAINMSLKCGNKLLARFLLNSGYYPPQKKGLKIIQHLLCLLPTSLTKKVL